MNIRTRNVNHRSATACVEASIVFLVLLPLLVGVWEVGRMVEVEQILQNAAREGGRQASTGNLDPDQVRQVVVRYLQQHGISCSASDITIENLTNSERNDPRMGHQLDRYRITIAIPFDSVRWILLDKITSVDTVGGSADWFSMRDLPVDLQTTIPAN